MNTRSTPLGQYHSAIFIGLGLAILLLNSLIGPLDPLNIPLVFALIVVILGVPHGTFDVALAKKKWNLNRKLNLGVFLAAYLMLAGFALLVWLLLPQLALPLFILISAYHFSGDWEHRLHVLPRVIVGLALITSPAIFHRPEVIEIFCFLVPSNVANRTAELMAVLAVPALQAAFIVLVINFRKNGLMVLEILTVMLLALFTEPLLFFLIYFCGLHSLRHMQMTYDELEMNNLSNFLRMSL